MIFYKTVSSGNDFIHVDLNEFHKSKLTKSDLAKDLCDRKTGIGSDGTVFYKINKDVVDFEIFNRDGTEAEISGNGMAGISALLFFLDKFENYIVLNTNAGKKKVQYLSSTKNNFKLKIEIGEPDFQNHHFFPFLKRGGILHKLDNIEFYPVSVGNPHCIVMLNEKIPDSEIKSLGNKLEYAEIFPFRTNVEFVFFKNKNNCSVTFHERGVGRTLSSSTGSAAVFAVLKRLKLIKNSLNIKTALERIKISGNKIIYIENSTKIVYKGIYY